MAGLLDGWKFVLLLDRSRDHEDAHRRGLCGTDQSRAVADAKVSADAGHSNLNLSPDGRWLTEIETTTDAATRKVTHKIAFIEVVGKSGTPAKYIDLRADIGDFIAITPDSKAVLYNIRESGVDNIWMQPSMVRLVSA